MKVGWQVLWSVTPICETSQICYLMGKLHTKDVLANHLKDLLFHLVHWLSIITLFLRKTSQESINLERESYLDCSSDTLCTREDFGRVTHWSQTSRSWRRWTHRKSTQKDLMQKKYYFPKEMENWLSSRRWTNETSWRRSRPENIHLDTGAPNSRRRSHWLSWRIRRISSTNSWLTSGCRWSDK